MKKSLRFLSVAVIIAMVLSIAGTVNAVSANCELASSSELKAGDTVEFTLKIKDMQAPDGIDNIQGTLEFDDCLEPIPDIDDADFENHMEGLNRWSIGQYNPANKTFLINRSSAVKTASDVLKITFKVKAGATATSATVKVKDIKATSGVGEGTVEFDIPEVSKTINKSAGGGTTPTPTPTPTGSGGSTTPTPTGSGGSTTPTPTPTPSGSGGSSSGGSSSGGSNSGGSSSSGSSSKGSSSKSTTTNSGTATGKLPQTGENAVIIAGSTIALAMAAGVWFIKYRRIDK